LATFTNSDFTTALALGEANAVSEAGKPLVGRSTVTHSLPITLLNKYTTLSFISFKKLSLKHIISYLLNLLLRITPVALIITSFFFSILITRQ
jgi:hypothetical protein